MRDQVTPLMLPSIPELWVRPPEIVSNGGHSHDYGSGSLQQRGSTAWTQAASCFPATLPVRLTNGCPSCIVVFFQPKASTMIHIGCVQMEPIGFARHLRKRWARFFRQGLDSKYLRLYRPSGLSKHSALLLYHESSQRPMYTPNCVSVPIKLYRWTPKLAFDRILPCRKHYYLRKAFSTIYKCKHILPLWVIQK